MCIFSKYILKKTKTFIHQEKYTDLDKLVLRLKKRGDVAVYYWFLDNTIKCSPKIWENVYIIFRTHANLFPIRIRPK